MKLKITKPDGTIIRATGSPEECGAFIDWATLNAQAGVDDEPESCCNFKPSDEGSAGWRLADDPIRVTQKGARYVLWEGGGGLGYETKRVWIDDPELALKYPDMYHPYQDHGCLTTGDEDCG